MIDVLLKKFCRWNRYRAWSDGSLWLSLDRFERFWPDAGLTLSNGAAVKSAVRAALRTKYAMDAEHRARRAIDPDSPVDMVYRNRIQTLPKGCITNIAETAGAPDAECVARWILGPVHKAVKWPSSSRWWCVPFYHLANEDPDAFASRYKISSETARKIIEISAHFRTYADAIKERTQAADQEPLRDWDAVAYADYRRDTPEASPLIGVRLYLLSVSWDQTWKEVVGCTNETDRTAIGRWGNELSAKHNQQMPDFEAIVPNDVRGPW